jgi:hypothetical protein
MEAGQGGDETGNDARFADVAGVSADDEDGHGRGSWLLAISSQFWH